MQRLEDRLDTLVLIAVDGALNEDRDLHPIAVRLQELLTASRVGERHVADLLPVVEVLTLLHGVEGIDGDKEQVPAQRRLTDDLEAHSSVARGDDVLEGAPDRVVRDVREAAGRLAGLCPVGQVARRVVLGRTAPRWRDVAVDVGGDARRRGDEQRGEHGEDCGQQNGAATSRRSVSRHVTLLRGSRKQTLLTSRPGDE